VDPSTPCVELRPARLGSRPVLTVLQVRRREVIALPRSLDRRGFGMAISRSRLALGLAGLASAAAFAGGVRQWTTAREPSKPGPTLYAARAPALSATQPVTFPVVPAALKLKQIYTVNQSAFIPPQCYTKTVDEAGGVHNPCYTCHVSSRAPNFIDDGDTQLEYSFVPRARENPWKNVFIDWTPLIAKVSDQEILAYIGQSNYFDQDRNIILAAQLARPPAEWDHGSDGVWSGFIPDARFDFDEQGFDRTPERGFSGWRAFAYYPVPGTFFPTNGSMGDVLIRLPEAFRQDESGKPDLTAYKLNLAVVEAAVTRKSVSIDAVDESAWGVDLDQNGKLARAVEVRFAGEPSETPPMSYVGRARIEQQAGRVRLAVGLYPEGAEFLHTVRYLEPTERGVRLAARLKELRYAKKIEWWSYARLDKRARVEMVEKEDAPSELRNFGGDIERGVHTGQGWTFQGFIEDAEGALRPQSFEENAYCVGCHGGVGTADDGIFSFSRRLGEDAFQRGFFHWSQRGLEGVADRPVAGGTEYANYLEQNGAGDEFRQNAEVQARFFDASGKLKPEMKARLQRDVTSLLAPSRERALALNKAYRLLVERQTFDQGRDIVLDGARNVHRSVTEGQKTGITEPVAPAWKPVNAVLARNR
jgi:hypothetical protein